MLVDLVFWTFYRAVKHSSEVDESARSNEDSHSVPPVEIEIEIGSILRQWLQSTTNNRLMKL
jgi:hypothetical protein